MHITIFLSFILIIFLAGTSNSENLVKREDEHQQSVQSFTYDDSVKSEQSNVYDQSIGNHPIDSGYVGQSENEFQPSQPLGYSHIYNQNQSPLPHYRNLELDDTANANSHWSTSSNFNQHETYQPSVQNSQTEVPLHPSVTERFNQNYQYQSEAQPYASNYYSENHYSPFNNQEILDDNVKSSDYQNPSENAPVSSSFDDDHKSVVFPVNFDYVKVIDLTRPKKLSSAKYEESLTQNYHYTKPGNSASRYPIYPNSDPSTNSNVGLTSNSSQYYKQDFEENNLEKSKHVNSFTNQPFTSPDMLKPYSYRKPYSSPRKCYRFKYGVLYRTKKCKSYNKDAMEKPKYYPPQIEPYRYERSQYKPDEHETGSNFNLGVLQYVPNKHVESSQGDMKHQQPVRFLLKRTEQSPFSCKKLPFILRGLMCR
ncbi:hypothetical protein FQA39_LY02270 [Lamprigera yunnana]|nr:hypothetical protein FQA39_LY02270 [Lamprigera yunnana]